MWQERQNVVFLERSTWLSNPSMATKPGNINKPMKAKILPPRAIVISGLATTITMIPMVTASKTNTAAVGIRPPFPHIQLLQTADVLHEVLYLIISKSLEGRHLAFTFFGGLDHVCV